MNEPGALDKPERSCPCGDETCESVIVAELCALASFGRGRYARRRRRPACAFAAAVRALTPDALADAALVVAVVALFACVFRGTEPRL